jgi:uncharacterized membrane protein YhaH (DUF805 family)
MIDAIKRFYLKYATFSGRASRSEYWWVQLFNGLVVIACYILMFALGAATADSNGQWGWGIGVGAVPLVLFALANIIPGLAITVRRLHDANLPGPWIFISFVPYLGAIVLLIMVAQPSKPEGARFD